MLARIAFVLVSILSAQVFAAPTTGKYFDRAIFVIFENTNYSDALKQPFLGQLARQGALLTNFMALTHPSQGNYIALTSGSLSGVTNDNSVDLDVRNIVDLLEAKGISWKAYAEDYPGNCFTGKSKGDYVRKHVPFLSYLNITRNSTRCAKIVNATEFDRDSAAGLLPNYVFFIPNIKNDGHDTGVAFADKWYKKRFTPFINDPKFMENTVLISTFDESGVSLQNKIYTSLYGPAVKPGPVSAALTIYSLLDLVETNWNLGNLGLNDANTPAIPASIWR